jgi:hypothetical protein
MNCWALLVVAMSPNEKEINLWLQCVTQASADGDSMPDQVFPGTEALNVTALLCSKPYTNHMQVCSTSNSVLSLQPLVLLQARRCLKQSPLAFLAAPRSVLLF